MFLDSAGFILSFCVFSFFQQSQCLGKHLYHLFFSHRLQKIIQTAGNKDTLYLIKVIIATDGNGNDFRVFILQTLQ